MKLVPLHVITTKLIIIAARLHKKALARHRDILRDRWVRSMEHLTTVNDARVQAQRRVQEAQHAVSEFDDAIHTGMEIELDMSKK